MPATNDGFHYELEEDDECWWIRFRYNPNLVDRIKQLPKGTRWWDADLKAWGIDPNWLDEAIRLLNGSPREPRAETRPPPSAGAEDTCLKIARSLTADHIELGILPDVPWEIIETVHRRWASLVHPDLGGDPEAMKKKNIARDNLARRYGKEKGR
jgi:hypothetical protein